MTLIIYLRCKDGSIISSDRQASERSGHSQEERKTFLSKTRDFIIGGSGTGFDVLRIFWRLSQDDSVNGNNIVEKLDELLKTYYEPFSTAEAKVHALLVTHETEKIAPYEIKIRGNQFYINPLNVRYRCCGILAARIIADYLLSKKKLDELHWAEAAQYVIATMKEVGKEVDSVGRLEEFGFDITVMLDNGSAYQSENYTENSADLVSELKILKDVTSKFNKINVGSTEES